jgi:hypothetical protein
MGIQIVGCVGEVSVQSPLRETCDIKNPSDAVDIETVSKEGSVCLR